MVAATTEAEKGYEDFHGAGPQWAWKFTILKVRALHLRGMDDAAIKLLASEASPTPSDELAIEKLRWEGRMYTSLHRFEQAEQVLGAADRICARSYNNACADVPDVRGKLEMERGHYANAQQLFEVVLASARASGDPSWEAATLLNLSWSALAQAHLDEALDTANSALRISLARNYADVAQKARGNVGWAYYRLGDPNKAEAMFMEAKNQAEKLGEVTSEVGWLTDLGYVYLDGGKYAIAEDAFTHSLKLSRQLNSKEDIINSLIALAFVSEQTGKLDDARRYADEALAKAHEDHSGPDEVYAELVLGRVAARLHDAPTAEKTFKEVAQSKDCPVFLKWEAERSLARLYEDEGQLDSAESEYRAALNTFETARSELQHVDSRLPFLSNAARIYDDYLAFLIARGKTAPALEVADYSRARTLREGLGLLSKGTAFAPQALNARQIASHAGGTILFYWLGERQSYLWAITPQKAALFRLPPAEEIKTKVERYRKAIVEQRESSPAAIDDGAALYRMLVEPAKDLLPKDGKKEAAGKGAAEKGTEEQEAAVKGTGVKETGVKGTGGKETGTKETGIKETKTGRVFIVPDGCLNSLNFETLLVPGRVPGKVPGETGTVPGGVPEEEQHYWIEDVTLSTANSLRLLESFRAAPGKAAGKLLGGNLLLIGNAVAPNADFPPLPKAAIEMEGIEKHFSPAQQEVFTRERANPPAYLASKPERFSYIHFVAHGTASRLSPLDSAIVLSRAQKNDKEDSYKLYAREIVGHPLRAELVTVSSCRSAGERAYSGEGLVGLSWAFVRAGAHNVIAALWDVSDDSSPQLMDELYGELKKGEAPDAALRQAKLKLLRSGASLRKPFYWAAFQLYNGS